MPAQRMNPFEVLASPVRLYLVELLCLAEQTSGDLAQMAFDTFGVGWSATSKHLAILEVSGFVYRAKVDTFRVYFLTDDWLDVVDRPVERLRTTWAEAAETRSLGRSAGWVARDTFLDPADRSPVDGSRSSRGRTARTLAADRFDRSVWRDDEPLTADFD